MKKAIYSLTLVSLLALATTVSAEEANVRMKAQVGSYADVKMELKARMGERASSSASSTIKARIEANKASSTAKRIEVQQNIAKRQMERAAKVFTATIQHLESILARVESRIAKVRAEGGAVLESETFVIEVKNHLSQAKTALNAFASIQVTSDKASENFEAVRKAGAEVKVHIREAHQSLMKAIRALKPGRDNNTATSTNP
jgi:hypothetical protein